MEALLKIGTRGILKAVQLLLLNDIVGKTRTSLNIAKTKDDFGNCEIDDLVKILKIVLNIKF